MVKKEIDWEQRRYEIAKDLFCAFIREQYPGNHWSIIKDRIIKFTDELIDELKKDKQMTKGKFYELRTQIDIDAAEYAKDKDDIKHICETAYRIGAMAMLQKICKL